MGAEETKKVQDNESKADKFVRLGEYRVNKVIDAIGRLENLSNRTNYEYTQEQVEAMFSIMEKKAFGSQRQICPEKGKRRYVFIWKKKQNREESQNEAVRKRNQCNKPEKHDEEVPDVWCHSIKADREITE